MFFIYSGDKFLLDKQQTKVINKLQTNNEIEVNIYSWIEDDVQKILDDILTPSFFVNQKVIVVKDAYFLTEKKKESHWINNDREKLNQLFKLQKIPNEIIFTLNEPKISQKLKLTKLFETNAKMIEVKELDFEQMVDFVAKKVKNKNKIMDLDVIQNFLKRLPNNMQIINNELTKLLNLNTNLIDLQILEDNVSHYSSSDAYKISEYFETNQIEPFINEFQSYLASTNDLVRLIYLLNTNLTFTRDCLILKNQGKDDSTIAKLLNAHPYRIKMALNKKKLTIKQLNDKILVLYDLNKAIISGDVDPVITAEIELIKNMTK